MDVAQGWPNSRLSEENWLEKSRYIEGEDKEEQGEEKEEEEDKDQARKTSACRGGNSTS